MNIFAPTPRMKPSVLNSTAGETTAFANPVIGTSVPAPPCLAIFGYSPVPVSTAEKNTSDTETQVPTSSSLTPTALNSSKIPWPIRQMIPPIRNALSIFSHIFELGEARSTIFEYSLFETFIKPPFHKVVFALLWDLCTARGVPHT